MKFKKNSILLLIFILLFVLSGCSKVSENSLELEKDKLGTIKVSLLNIPDFSKAELMNTAENQQEIYPDKLVFTLTKGNLKVQKEVVLTDEPIKEIAIDKLEEGNWTVQVELIDKKGYRIYEGSNGVTVIADSVAQVKVELLPAPGDLKIIVPLPQDLEVVSGEVILNKPVEGTEITKELEFSNGIGTAEINDLRPMLWHIVVVLKNNQGESLVKATGEIYLLPGRSNIAELSLPGNGNLEIQLTFENLPLPPEYVTATYDGSRIILNWQAPPVADIAGYMVYRSMEEEGRKILLSDSLVTETTYIDTDHIYPGNNYWYWVQTYDQNGFASDLSQPCWVFANESITFADYNLEMAVREKINKLKGNLTYDDVKNIQELEADGRGIKFLEGIEYLTSLERVFLDNNNITDIKPLSKLPKLRELITYNNQISDITSLTKISTLEGIDLSYNNITDATPLGDLNLSWLNIGANPIVDFEGLINALQEHRLYYLGLREMNIDDTKFNVIADSLDNVGIIALDNNRITDLTPLTRMKNLIGVRVGYNPIQDYSLLSEMTHYLELGLDYMTTNDYSFLSNLTELMYLTMRRSNISDADLKYLSGLTKLEFLSLAYTNISDLSSIINLKKIKILDISDCNVSNIEPLLDLPNLQEVYLEDNPLDLSTDSRASQVISELEGRGVIVYY